MSVWKWTPKKLFWVNGKSGVDIRDYDLERCAKADGMIIQYGSDVMRLSAEDCAFWLESGNKSQQFKSRIGKNKFYHLITIPWNPTGTTEQGSLL